MKFKVIEKRSIFVSLFSIFYLLLFMALSNPVLKVIEKYVFNYEKPEVDPLSPLSPIPNKVEINSFIIYFFGAIIVYSLIMRAIKIKNE